MILAACVLPTTILGICLLRRAATGAGLALVADGVRCTVVEPLSDTAATPKRRIWHSRALTQLHKLHDLSNACGEERIEPERMAIARRNRLISVLRGRLTAHHGEPDTDEARRRS